MDDVTGELGVRCLRQRDATTRRTRRSSPRPGTRSALFVALAALWAGCPSDAPTPSDPVPTPNETAPTPDDPAPTPADPVPTPDDPAPTPGDPAPTPGDPAPTPGDPAPPPSDPAAAPPAPRQVADGFRTFEADSVAVALSGNGQHLAAGDLGGRVFLWDIPRERLLIRHTTPEGSRVHRVAFARTAPLLASGAFERPDVPVRLWQLNPAGPRHTLGSEGWQVRELAVDAAGEQVLALLDVGLERLVLVLWRVNEDARPFTAPVDSDEAHVALSGDGATAAVSELSGALRIWRGAPWAQAFEGRVEGAATLQRLVLAEDGATLWGAAGANLFRYDLSGEEPVLVATVELPGEAVVVRGLEVLDDGRAVAVTRPASGGLRVWSADSGALIATVESGCRCEGHALSGDGRTVACDCVPEPEIRVWSLPAPL